MAADKGLQVAPGLTLPPDAVTRTMALLAVTGAGKSNAGAVLAEELYDGGYPFVAIEPKGDWWGLRSSADGKSPGLLIPIFGGLHGDVPLTARSGKLVAELIVAQNLTCILDVSRFESKADQMRFLTDFGKRLFALHQEHPQPRHIIMEEAEEYVPQRFLQNQAPCVGMWSKIVKQGRVFGLGVTVISQRSASVNKDVLTQMQTLIALRSTSSQDRRAIRDWVDYNAASREIVDALPGLDNGEAYVVSPQWLMMAGLPAVQKIRFRQRRTFDSGATPTMRKRAARPATLADIDVRKIAGEMEAVAEEAEKNDPAALRREVTRLKRELARAQDTAGNERVQELAAETVRLRGRVAELEQRPPEIVEVPVLTEEQAKAFLEAADRVTEVSAIVKAAVDRASSSTVSTALTDRRRPPPQRPAEAARTAPAPPASVPAADNPADAPDSPATLGVAPKKILTVLAQFQEEGRTRKQIAMLARYSQNSGAFSTALGVLRRYDMITHGTGQYGRLIKITQAGLDAIGDDYEPLPSGAELVDHWVRTLGTAPGRILRLLLDVWPEGLTRGDIAQRLEYSANSGAYSTALGNLRAYELVTDSSGFIFADETLALEAGGVNA